MAPLKLRAPSGDGELLAVPELERAAELRNQNRAFLNSWDHNFQGRRAGVLRSMAGAETIRNALAFHRELGLPAPRTDGFDGFIITGHQPELFHPGVWVKNFAVWALAREFGAGSLNLIVDNDLPKAEDIRVPRRGEDGAGLAIERIAFDSGVPDSPFEEWTIRDPELLRTFPERVLETLGGLVHDPLISEFGRHLQDPVGPHGNLGRLFTRARHLVEADRGVQNLELPLSSTCESESFLWFCCHLLAHLPRYLTTHNEELLKYRRAHGIRSRNHPVADLAVAGDWLEAPFWVWRSGEKRRRALLARTVEDRTELKIAGEAEPFIELPLARDREACCAVEALKRLPVRGIRLRTRALTTTMYARLFLGDLFIHGIGGAKYDELGDEIIRGFLDIKPPEFLTISMTLRLGLAQAPLREVLGRLHAVERRLRDLRYNPDRYADVASSEVERLIAQKRECLALPAETSAERRLRTSRIREANERLVPFVSDLRKECEAEHALLVRELKRSRAAENREYSLVLHDRQKLAKAFDRFGVS